MTFIKRKKILGLYLVLIAGLLTQSVLGATNLLLPQSSHYEGKSYFDSGQGTTGRIEFAVYDTQGGNEFLNSGFTAAGSGRYIYAYQIFCGINNVDILDYFAILGIGEGALAAPVNDNISYIDDTTFGSVSPISAYIQTSSTEGTIGVWEFEEGVHLAGGDYSWFMVLRSNQDWMAGNYTFVKQHSDTVPKPEPIPEPATMIILGIGFISVLSKRKRNIS